MKKMVLLTLALALAPLRAAPVKSADFYVSPYYAAEGGQVRTLRGVDEPLLSLLASGKAQDLAAARAHIEKNAAAIPPLTLMVLAARLYDAGQRDEAVFWFYVAKDRYSVFVRVIDTSQGARHEEETAMTAFRELLGPYINSYAFCDLKNQQRQRARALEWVRAHPQAALNDPSLPALGPDRAALTRAALQKIQASADGEARWLNNGAEMKKLQEQRRAQGVDEQFCWK